MPLARLAFLLVAGVGGGLAASIAGLASIVTFPALLAVGLGPLAANVTNTVALICSGVGAALGSRPELEGQAQRVRWLVPPALAGGLVGATLLLATPRDAFHFVAPELIGVASLGILVRSRSDEQPLLVHARPRGLPFFVFAIAIYGGYFGAAAGVLLLAVLLAVLRDTLPRCNAVKNILLGSANAIAAVAFAIIGPVHWEAALPLAIGLLGGARVGPYVVRRAPVRPLRALIALGGLALAVHLGLQAFG